MSTKRYHILVNGRVQGVGFRYYTRDTAVSLGLAGWVRNLNSGGVELEVEGIENDIDMLIEKLKLGPTLARVADVSVQPLAVINNDTEFLIKR